MKITYKQFSNIVMILACLAICMGIYMRDVMGVGINKYLFLIIAVIPILLVRFEDVIVFAAFLLPLYVGLPGNYITVVLIARLFVAFYNKEVKCRNNLFWTSLALFAYYFCSNAIYGYMGPYHIVGTFDFLVFAFLANATLQYDKKDNVILAYGAGVASVCVVMLMATLRFFSFADLMSGGARLGATGMLFNMIEGDFATSLDPNFNGYNVIALLSCVYPILPRLKGFRRFFALIVTLISVIIGLAGLSRAFVLALGVWILLVALTEKKLWKAIGLFFAVGVVLVIVYTTVPEVIEGLANRFAGGDMEGGNGRSFLMNRNFHIWQESVFTMLFGRGVYNDNTHFSPILHFFALGFLGFFVLLLWYVQLIKLTSRYYKVKKIGRFVPFVVTFFMSCTIPAVGALNWMFPLILSIIAMSGERREIDEKN